MCRSGHQHIVKDLFLRDQPAIGLTIVKSISEPAAATRQTIAKSW